MKEPEKIGINYFGMQNCKSVMKIGLVVKALKSTQARTTCSIA